MRKKAKVLSVSLVMIALTVLIIANLTIPGPVASSTGEGDSEVLLEDFQCSLVGVTGSLAADNDIFFGQTMDNPWWPTRHTLWVIQPEKGYKYIGTKAYIWGFWTGLNEKGLGWVGAYVSCKDKTTEGINRFDIGPMLLSSCANVKEAIDFLSKIERGPDFPPRNALIGDAEGNLALIEISYQSINVETLTKDGYIVRTNHFISKKNERHRLCGR